MAPHGRMIDPEMAPTGVSKLLTNSAMANQQGARLYTKC